MKKGVNKKTKGKVPEPAKAVVDDFLEQRRQEQLEYERGLKTPPTPDEVKENIDQLARVLPCVGSALAALMPLSEDDRHQALTMIGDYLGLPVEIPY